MIDDINARLDTEEEMLELAPKYFGSIPVGEEDIVSDGDVLAEFDAYFGQPKNGDTVQKSPDELTEKV